MKPVPLLLSLGCLVSCLSPLKFSTCGNGTPCPAKLVCNAQTLICESVDAGVADSGPSMGPPDAGLDAGPDGGSDAGLDAGPEIPLPRYGMTVVRGNATYGTVYAIGGIDASGQLSTRVDQFVSHTISGPLHRWSDVLPPTLALPVAFASAAPYHNIVGEDGELVIGGIGDGGANSLTQDADLGHGVAWDLGPSLPQPISYAGATVDPDDPVALTWLIGGFDSNGTPVALVSGFDLGTLPAPDGGWGAEAPIAHARGGLGVDVIQGHFGGAAPPVAYAIGGWELDAGALVPSSAAETYVTGVGWSDLPPLPLARGGLGVASDDKFQVFAIGGSTGAFGTPVPTAEIDVFNADAGTWTTLDAGLPSARWGLGAAFAYDGGEGDVIVIFGGQLPDGGVSGETDILNPATLQIVVLPGG